MEKGALHEMLGGMRFQTTVAINFFFRLFCAVVGFLLSFPFCFLPFVCVVFTKMKYLFESRNLLIYLALPLLYLIMNRK